MMNYVQQRETGENKPVNTHGTPINSVNMYRVVSATVVPVKLQTADMRAAL